MRGCARAAGRRLAWSVRPLKMRGCPKAPMDLHAQSLWLHAAFILAFLVSGPVRSEEPSAAPPSEWGRVAPRLLDQGCPAISGSFRVIGEAAPTNKSNANQRIYGLLFHPRGSKAVTSEPLSEIVATDGLTFSIVQNDAKSFEALLIASDGATRRRLTFERGLGDYTLARSFCNAPLFGLFPFSARSS